MSANPGPEETALQATLKTELEGNERRWFGEPVCRYVGPIRSAPALPHFERRPFALGDVPLDQNGPPPHILRPCGENKYWDVIVRMPVSADEKPIPVGIVSKHYRLVQHRDLFKAACEAMQKSKIPLEEVSVELILSTYGGKMEVIFDLPQKFSVDPGDGDPLTLQFICVNSVDGRAKLTFMMGWYRFICSNGLIVGTSRLAQRFAHREYVDIPDLARILSEGILLADQEKAVYATWRRTPIQDEKLIDWIDGPLKARWGALAAARTYLICRTGCDGRFADPFERAHPHKKQMVRTREVPGAPKKADDAYSVCQALAWIAKERRDVQDQLDRMREIPELMNELVRI